MSVYAYEGFDFLIEELNDYIKKAENPIEILKIGAEEFVNDLSKLAKPYSKINRSGYTHLVDSFCYEVNKKNIEIEVGWGKYYGRMVEDGTRITSAQPHLAPIYEKNKEKYYKKMVENF